MDHASAMAALRGLGARVCRASWESDRFLQRKVKDGQVLDVIEDLSATGYGYWMPTQADLFAMDWRVHASSATAELSGIVPNLAGCGAAVSTRHRQHLREQAILKVEALHRSFVEWLKRQDWGPLEMGLGDVPPTFTGSDFTRVLVPGCPVHDVKPGGIVDFDPADGTLVSPNKRFPLTCTCQWRCGCRR